MKRQTKIISLIFCLVLVVSVFAVSAFAALVETEFNQDTLNTNVKVVLDKDETEKNVQVGTDVAKNIIDLNGFTLSLSTLTVPTGKTLVLQNGTLNCVKINLNGGAIVLDNVNLIAVNNAFDITATTGVEIKNSKLEALNVFSVKDANNVAMNVKATDVEVKTTNLVHLMNTENLAFNVDFLGKNVFHNNGSKFLETMTSTKPNVTVNIADQALFDVLPQKVENATVKFGENGQGALVKRADGKYRLLPGLVGDIYLNIDSDINLVYIADIALPNPVINFTLAEEVTAVEGVKRADGKFEFRFEKIDPRYLGDTIKIELVGGELTKPTANFTIKDYCLKVLEKYPTDEKLKTLVSDLLYLGSASQKYRNYNVENLVTNGIEDKLTPSTYAPVTTITKAFGGKVNPEYFIKGAGLRIEGEINMFYNIYATDASNLKLRVEIEGKAPVYIPVVADKDNTVAINTYRVIVPVDAYNYSKEIKVQIVKDDLDVGQSLLYKVESYITEKLNEGVYDENTQAILKAISNYGKSASNYYYKVEEVK